jgi:hypothetical protein
MLDAGCWEGVLPQHPASSIQHLFSEEMTYEVRHLSSTVEQFSREAPQIF